MQFLISLFFALVFFLASPAGEAKGTIIFVPLDNRPVCLSYTVETLQSAGWEITTPPADYIASRYQLGEADKLLSWLEEQAPTASYIVASADALLYGGLVASRTHDFSLAILEERLERLAKIKNSGLGQNIYLFSTIMRTPRASSGGVEPPYYEVYGPDIFRWSALSDKEEIQGLTKKEQLEKQKLQAKIPSEVMQDWLERRQKNLWLNEQLFHLLLQGNLNYFVLGKDDTAPFSQSHKEARAIEELSQQNKPWNFRLFVGADQLGLLLLTRVVNEAEYQIPFVEVRYAEGMGAETIPSYEDKPVGHTVREHIFASGSFPVKQSSIRSDLQFLVNTPFSGLTKEASSPENIYEANDHLEKFSRQIEQALQNSPVAIADVEFGNGSSNALVQLLLEYEQAYRLAAYAGWNTASNSIGYALSQGLLSKNMQQVKQQEILTTRYLDEWAYQANTRNYLYTTVVWPHGLDGTKLDENKSLLRETALEKIKELSREHGLPADLSKLKVDFPWNRLFEVFIDL